MTDGEQMIWAAAWGAYVASRWGKGPVNIVDGVEVARAAVQLATAGAVNADGLFSHATPSALSMLRSMLGAGEVEESFCPRCADFIAGGKHSDGRWCGTCGAMTVGKVRPTCHGTGNAEGDE